MADRQAAQHMAAPNQSNIVKKFTNLAGAVVSLALVAGIGVWGYKLLVRDVSGVPVVRAAEGPMRVQPEDPGGRQASHQGLAVNAVAAEGTAAKPADRLILAPKPLDLTLEDMPKPELAALSEPPSSNVVAPAADAPIASDADDTSPSQTADAITDQDRAVQLVAVEALAARMAEGVAPLQDLEPSDQADTQSVAQVETASIGAFGRP